VDHARVEAGRQEQLQARAEVMVGGDLVVEAQHLRAIAEQRRGMRHVLDNGPAICS
jgi:predicted thioesterase